MAFFTEQEIRNFARQSIRLSTESYSSKLRSITESQKNRSYFDIFLSHSIKDEELVLGVVEVLKRFGKIVYVDWIDDPQLSRSFVTADTANVLRYRMSQSSKLLYLATNNSPSSKWMPWELGYFDGLKTASEVAILPILRNENDVFQGQEYLGIYHRIHKEDLPKL